MFRTRAWRRSRVLVRLTVPASAYLAPRVEASRKSPSTVTMSLNLEICPITSWVNPRTMKADSPLPVKSSKGWIKTRGRAGEDGSLRPHCLPANQPTVATKLSAKSEKASERL